MDIESFHSCFFNVLARIFPELEDLHYGLAEEPPTSPFGMVGRLQNGGRRLLDRLSDLVSMNAWPADAVGLDVGCGLGGTARFLARRHGFRMLGLNINTSQLRLAVERNLRRGGAHPVVFTAGDARHLPFGDASFDFTVLIEVAFHVREKDGLFGELARVLRPGGRVVLVDQELSEAAEVMGLFFFLKNGGYRRVAEEAGLRVAGEVDLTRELTWWMTDYARAASWPFHAGALLLALVRGGPRLAREYAAGVRAFNRLIRKELLRIEYPRRPTPFFNGIRALRKHTLREFEAGRSTYKLLLLRKPS